MNEAWLEPLSGSPCGEDLEYDNDFLVLAQAATGKPGTQFKPEGEPPNWREVRSLAEGMFERTRDLRVAVLWTRSMLYNEGALTLPDGLSLITALLERFWDDLHPKPDPDDGDAYARINTLAEMSGANGLLGDLRSAFIVRDRAVGELRGRDVEIALGLLEPRADEMPMSTPHVEQLLSAAAASNPAIGTLAARTLEQLNRLVDLMRERVGYERAPDCQALIALFKGLDRLMPGDGSSPAGDEQADLPAGDGSPAAAAPRGAAPRGGGLGTRIETREDAVRAIQMVCEYLERTEPTSPAQWMLRRAAKLVNKNFLELMREFAPDAFHDVARVMGVSPDEYGDGQ